MNVGRMSLKLLGRFMIILLAIALWQILSIFGVMKSGIIPSPYEVATALISLFGDGTLVADILISLKRVIFGFLLASILGISIGLALYLNKSLYKLTTPLLEVLRPLPPIAWIPLAILWFGIGDKPAYFLIIIAAFFPIFTNTFEGLKSIKLRYIHVAKNLRAKRFRIIKEILLPAALPHIFTGLKIGLGFSWVALIAAEMVGSTSGLGYMIQLNRILLQTDNVIAGMVVIGLIGYVMHKIMIVIEQKLTKWRIENAG